MEDITEIIKGCLKNDRRSQFKMYDYCFDTLMSICWRYEKDEDTAVEMLNTAFIKILEKLDTYNPEYSFKPWIQRIMVNECIDYYRKKKRKQQVFDGNEEVGVDGGAVVPIDADEHWIETEYLSHMMQTLSDMEKLVFNLYAIDGFSHKEIANDLNISERSSIRHLGNARKHLQSMLSESQYGAKGA